MSAEQIRQHPEEPDRESDAVADPANNDDDGHDWSAEGGATPAGPATSVDPQRVTPPGTDPSGGG